MPRELGGYVPAEQSYVREIESGRDFSPPSNAKNSFMALEVPESHRYLSHFLLSFEISLDYRL